MEYGSKLWKLRQEGYRRFHPGLYNETMSQGEEGMGRQRQTERHTETESHSERDWDIKIIQLSQLLIYWWMILGHFLSKLLLHFPIYMFDTWARRPQKPSVAKTTDWSACSCLLQVARSSSHHCSLWEAKLLHSGSRLQLKKSQWRRQKHNVDFTSEVK